MEHVFIESVIIGARMVTDTGRLINRHRLRMVSLLWYNCENSKHFLVGRFHDLVTIADAPTDDRAFLIFPRMKMARPHAFICIESITKYCIN